MQQELEGAQLASAPRGVRLSELSALPLLTPQRSAQGRRGPSGSRSGKRRTAGSGLRKELCFSGASGEPLNLAGPPSPTQRALTGRVRRAGEPLPSLALRSRMGRELCGHSELQGRVVLAQRAASPRMGGKGSHGACSRRPSVGLSTLLPLCGDGPAPPPGGQLRLSKPRAYIVGIFLPVESLLLGHVQLTCGPRGPRCWASHSDQGFLTVLVSRLQLRVKILDL